LLLWVALTGRLWAQSDTAALWGVVTDAEGKPLEGMTVFIADLAANVVVRRPVTDSAGRYYAPYLKPGLYQILIEESGYQAFQAEPIRLDPGQSRRFDARMTPGDPSQTVQVRPPEPLVRTHPGQAGVTLDYKTRWPDAPHADRHPTLLPLLVTSPAVQGDRNGLVISGLSSRRQQSWLSDGIADDTTNQTLNPVATETVEVVLANPDASAARPAGFLVVSKRAGERLHGTMFYKHGASRLNARSFFDTQAASYRQREAGGEMGWDLIPDWTWLYGSGMYQLLLYRQNLYADIPSAKMRDGDLSQFLDPQIAPNGKTVAVRDPRSGLPFARNLIPMNRISSVSLNYVRSYYQLPNLGDANTLTRNYTWLHRFGPDDYNGNWPLARWDQRVTSQHQFYLRWLQNQTASVVPGSVGRPLDATRTLRYRSLLFSDTHAFSSRLVNHLSLARVRARIKQGESEGDVDPPRGDSVVSTVGLQGVNPQGFSAMGFPAVSIAGLTGLSMPHGGGAEDNIARNDGFFTLRQSLTWTRGRHSLRGGVDHSRYFWRLAEVPQTVYGAFAFSGAFTGLGYADFLLGYPATSSRQTARVNRRVSQDQTGLYLADSFRVHSRVTLELGARWDYYASPTYDDGYMANWDPQSGKVIVAPGTFTSLSAYYPKSIAVEVGRVVPEPKTVNVRPRLGLAVRLSENAALRAGYGEFTESPGYGPEGRLPSTNPYWLKETYTNWVPITVPALAFPRPFPTNPAAVGLPSQTVTALPMKTEEGVLRQANLTLEHAWRSLGWSLSYIGFRGVHMNYTLDVNKPRASAAPFDNSRKPYPQFGSAYVTRTDGRWNYDSLAARVRHRHGPLLLESAFTWADNRSNYANTLDPYNVTNRWTRDAATRRLYSATSASWSLPVGRGRRFLAKAGPVKNLALGNWTLHALATFATGQYYSPWFTGPDPANASPGFVTLLPDCVGNPDAGARNKNLWFNPAAFAVPPAGAGRYGSCGMNILEGYPVHVGHVSLAKQIPLGESWRAVFTAQISNLTNTPHFGIPNNNLSYPNPGAFTASSVETDASPARQGPRQITLKLRLEW